MKINEIRALQRQALADYRRATTHADRVKAEADHNRTVDEEDRRSIKRAAGWSAEKQAASWDGGADDNRPAMPMTAADEQAKRLMIEQRSGRVTADVQLPIPGAAPTDRASGVPSDPVLTKFLKKFSQSYGEKREKQLSEAADEEFGVHIPRDSRLRPAIAEAGLERKRGRPPKG